MLFEHKIVLILYKSFVWNISHYKKINPDVIMYAGRHVKYPVFLSGFTKTWIFLTDFLFKKLKYQI
jgi:hypothetical protein